MKNLAPLLFLSVFSLPAFAALQCGDTITTTVKMTQDLNCSTYTGYSALSVRGNGIIKGEGYKIITPNTAVGVYAEGNTIKIQNLEIQGSTSAIGIQGYNVVRLVVDSVKASGMNIGVDFYTEVGSDCDRLKVVDSNLSSNNYGAKVISPNCEYFPKFARTDFSHSYQYALNLSAKTLKIREVQDNTYTGSANGLLLKASESILVEGVDMASAQVDGTQIYAYSSPAVDIKNVNVGNNLNEGINIYDVGQVTIKNVTASGGGVGIKVANEQRATNLNISNSETSGNSIGLLVTSYGSVKFSAIDISKKNKFSDTVSIQGQ